MKSSSAPQSIQPRLTQRVRLFTAGVLGLAFALTLILCVWSYARPAYVIQHIQTLPASMQWDRLPPGTWAGSQRRLIALEHGRFSGSTQIWWDAVPPPTSPSSLAGMGAGGSSFSPNNLVFPNSRSVPAGFDGNGKATTSALEWAVPLWSPVVFSLTGLTLLLLPELLALFTLRSRRRRSRGQCVRCAYDLRTPEGASLAVCPECGLADQSR